MTSRHEKPHVLCDIFIQPRGICCRVRLSRLETGLDRRIPFLKRYGVFFGNHVVCVAYNRQSIDHVETDYIEMSVTSFQPYCDLVHYKKWLLYSVCWTMILCLQ